MKWKLNRTVGLGAIVFLLLVGLGNCSLSGSLDLPADVAEAMLQLPDELDYNIHVKKVLSDKCFSCHGPDAAKQQADLRLDLASAAYEKTTQSGLKAIKAGNISKSEVAHRILSTAPDYKMPTPASHLTLSATEKAILIKWIDDGAVYKPHWAFEQPEMHSLPKITQKDWAKNDIDHFVLAKLEEEGIQPSAEANREALIRRVSFDLTGLPPAISEIDEFVADQSANAYEKMVDRYLQSPHYGERMAAYWLDLARFADSHGYLDDKHRDASPWRDWVIKAYNQNLPFDQFITWQLAGDLLPNPTKEQILATGFNRNQKQNSEAGILPEEFRVEYVVDRTNTIGTAVMGLTISCAKCHDHKYDPISHKDYFSLYAFFNSTFELGSSNYGADANIVPGPTLLLTSDQQDQQIADLTRRIKALEKVKPEEPALDPSVSLSSKLIASLGFDKIENVATYGKKSIQTVPAYKNTVQPLFSAKVQAAKSVPGIIGNSVLIEEETLVNLPPYKLGNFERYEPFSFSVWVYLPKNYDETAILHHSDPRRYGFQGYDLQLKNNRLNFRLMHAFPHDAISVLSKASLDSNKWNNIVVSYDGSSKAAGVRLFINGQPASTEIEYDNLVKNIRPFDNIHKVVPFTGLSFGARSLERTMKGAMIDQFYLFDNTVTTSEAAWLFQQKTIALKERKLPGSGTPDTLKKARMELANLYDTIKEAMVMGDLPVPRNSYVLLRGIYDSYGDQVFPRTPEAILPFPDSLPKNRLGLSKWLFLPENPLTSRIAVNRIWEMYFGNGLVKTSDDFGNQGEMPSHPELLDYLSITYQKNGWNTKALQKMILMSATYRQSAVVRPELLEKDPGNRLLARSSRYKMPAEMIRDQALSISGLLSSKIGGESVYPYQPSGLWEALSDKSWRYNYIESEGEDLFRRSIYTVVKRSSPPPFMLIFDAPDRNFCTVKRTSSSSPLQALALMNDPTFVEASKFIATRMLQEGGTTREQQLTYGFRLVTGRKPTTAEMSLLQKMYEEEYRVFSKTPAKAKKILAVGKAAVPVIGNKSSEAAAYVNTIMALLNTDEFITRN